MNWEDCKEYINRMFGEGMYEILWALMLEEINGKFPDGVPSTDSGREDLKAYLTSRR